MYFISIIETFIAGGGSFGGAGAADEEDEDALLQRALEMSMMEQLSVNEAAASTAQESKVAAADEDEVGLSLLQGL